MQGHRVQRSISVRTILFYVDLVETTLYIVTQSYANSFWGDVVLDTFNNVYRDEDNILDQIYRKQICPNLYYDDFLFL